MSELAMLSALDEDHNSHPSYDKKTLHAEATVSIAEEHDLLLGTILRGTAANRLTPSERKAALINAYVLSYPPRPAP
jgi:hypothetical protein